MGSDWKTSRLEDCMEAIIDYRGKTPPKTTSGVPLVTAKIIKHGTMLPVTEYIAEEDYVSWMRRGIPQASDVVMTTEAPLGEVAQLDSRKIALAQRVITLRGKKNELDNTFLKYLMLSSNVQDQLIARSTGTTVKGIKQKELREIELTYPDCIHQRAIAHILGSLDDKIDLNRQMNSTLEKMAQAIFKSWFIDFEPFKNGEFVYNSEWGREIPKEWEIKAIGEIANLRNGISYSGKEKYEELVEGSYIFITLNNTIEGGGFKPVFAWIKSHRLRKHHFLEEGDLIIPNTEQTKDERLLGSPGIVFFPYDYKNKKGVFSHHITKILPINPIYKLFLYLFPGKFSQILF